MQTEQQAVKLDAKEFLNPMWIIAAMGVIFLVAFALNFVALSRFAANVMEIDLMFRELVDFAQESILPFGFPILVDIFLLMATFALLRNATVGESAWLAIGVIVFTSLLAVTLNALHYNVYEYYTQGNYKAALSGAIYSITIPATILFTSEFVRSLLQSMQRRSMFVQLTKQLKAAATQAQVQHDELIAQLKAQSDEAQAQLKAQKEKLNAQLEAQEKERTAHQQQLNDLLTQIDAARTQLGELREQATKPSKEWVEAIQLDALLAVGLTHKLSCQMLKFSENTGRARLERCELNGQSLAGRGIEVGIFKE